MSSEYVQDGASAQQWVARNKPLFRYLANELKLRDPETYAKMNNIPWLNTMVEHGAKHVGQKNNYAGEVEIPLDKLGELWPALAINEGQTDAGGVHKDYKDHKDSFNCVIPYGDWEGGDVLLWDLRKRVEVKEGQALFFRGRIILHNAWKLQGTRHSVDLFLHDNIVALDKKKGTHVWVKSSKNEKNVER